MPRTKKSKFTEQDEKRVWDAFSKGLQPMEVSKSGAILIGSTYNLLEKAKSGLEFLNQNRQWY